MSTLIDLDTMSSIELADYLRQKKAQEQAEAQRTKLTQAPAELKAMADDADQIIAVLEAFKAAVGEAPTAVERLVAMELYHRKYFAATTAFQSHSTAARISKPFFVAELMTPAERAAYHAKKGK